MEKRATLLREGRREPARSADTRHCLPGAATVRMQPTFGARRVALAAGRA